MLSVTGAVQAQENPGGKRSDVQAHGDLAQGSRVFVGRGAAMAILLADGSVVRIAANSELSLEQLPNRSDGSPTALRLERGRMDAKVQPQRARRFEVRSPLAVAGVRGTVFGVTVAQDGHFSSDVSHGSVVVRSTRSGRSTLVEARQGASVGPHQVLSQSSVLPAVDADPRTRLLAFEGSWLELAYASVPGASAYRFQVAGDDSFVRVLRNGVFRQAKGVFAGLPQGDYWVSVRALDAQGLHGEEFRQALQVRAAPMLARP